jgi:hypothetical protein
MHILMTILDHKPSQLPVAISTKQLFDLATVSSKCDVVGSISAQVECQTWIRKLWHHDRPHDGEWGTWLWILHTFHTTEEDSWRYERVLEALAASMIFYNNSWVLGRVEHRLQFSRIQSALHTESINGKQAWKTFLR